MEKATNSVLKIRENNLCISCGTCAAGCPRAAISFVRARGMYLPVVSDACVDCGKCLVVCPSANMLEEAPQDLASYCLGEVREILCARATDEEALANSTSGGVVTTMVRQLLSEETYDSAFLLDGYQYDSLLSTTRFEEVPASSAGSRYLTVSHEHALRYILSNREERCIFVGTPCALVGILRTIHTQHLTRENYLLIGLFCDKTMHYGVVDYFRDLPEGAGREMTEMKFRSKEKVWPGKVKLTYADGESLILPSSARKNLKYYFVPERCLYCYDKLNRVADISVGDNYISANHDERGVSSVVVRTSQGADAWAACRDGFEWYEDSAAALLASQHIGEKRDALAYAAIKGLLQDIPVTKEQRKQYRAIMKKMELGRTPHPYRAVSRALKRAAFVGKWKRRVKKLLGQKV